MVNSGNTNLKGALWVARFDGERIRLPVETVQAAQRSKLVGEEAVECWLLVLTAGRYRLVPQAAAAESEDLQRLLRQIEDSVTPGEVLDRTGNNALDGIQARLIPCRVSPPKPGWRLNFPNEALSLVPANEERSFVYLKVVAGFMEVWFPDTLRRALSTPISDILT